MSATSDGAARIDCSETDDRYPVVTTSNGYIQCPGCDRSWRIA